MRRYFFPIHGEHGTADDTVGVVLSDHDAAMLRAVTICAEIGCSGGFHLGSAIGVREERGATTGRVTVIVATAIPEGRDA